MEVLIVSKTRMSNAVCVGGILENGRWVRLLDQRGYNQPMHTSLNVGDVCDISFFEPLTFDPPHVEDVLVSSVSRKSSFPNLSSLSAHLRNNLKVKVWQGDPDLLFDGKLLWTEQGSGYVARDNGLPSNSVGFWLTERRLTKSAFDRKVRYSHPPPSSWSDRWRRFAYVGFQEAVDAIPARTLVRVSLARWWSPADGDTEERCYLQLSGWYPNP